jgi:hypothetical protein
MWISFIAKPEARLRVPFWALKVMALLLGAVMVALVYWQSHTRELQGRFPVPYFWIVLPIAYVGLRLPELRTDFVRSSLAWLAYVPGCAVLSARASNALESFGLAADSWRLHLYAVSAVELLAVVFAAPLLIVFFDSKPAEARFAKAGQGFVAAMALIVGCSLAYLGRIAVPSALHAEQVSTVQSFKGLQFWIVQASCFCCGLLVVSLSMPVLFRKRPMRTHPLDNLPLTSYN